MDGSLDGPSSNLIPTRKKTITNIENGQLFRDLGINPLSAETDRAKICGSMEMIADTKALLEQSGLREGSNAQPGDFVVEKAFAG